MEDGGLRGNCGIARVLYGNRAADEVAPQFTSRTEQWVSNFSLTTARLCRRFQNRLFAGETERRFALAFSCGEPALLARNIVPRDRHHALALGKLDLHHHHVLLAEGHFRSCEIELPHTHEMRLIDPFDVLAMSQKPLTPGLQGLGIVHAKNFNIRDKKASALDRWHHFRQ